MKKRTSFDVGISGGGIAGLALSLLLATEGLSVAVIEPHPPQHPLPIDGRTAALMNSSVSVLRATGLPNSFFAGCAPLKSMRIIDDSTLDGAPIEVMFEAKDLGLGEYGLNIPNMALREALYTRVQADKRITVIPQALTSLHVQETHITACLTDGEEISAYILVGADGRSSHVRKLNGFEVWKKEYDLSALTCLIAHSKPHDNTATEFHRAGGPLALVPMPGLCSSIVWVDNTGASSARCSLSEEDFTAALQTATQGLLGQITLKTKPTSWPLSSLRAKNLIAPRSALIAEAAHVLSPITAQGLNLSLRDVAVLAETILDAHQLGLDIGSYSTLSRYESKRLADITLRVHGVDGMLSLVSTQQRGIKTLRRSGLKLVSSLAPLKKTAMRIGLAPQDVQSKYWKAP